MQSGLIRRNDLPDSIFGEHPRQRDYSDGSKAVDLSMLSQKISASVKSSCIPRNASVGQRSLRDRAGKSYNETQQQGGGRNVKDDTYELALKIIEETQGKKLPRVNSTRNKDAPFETESRDSSMVQRSAPRRHEKKILTSASNSTHQLGTTKAPSGPAVRDMDFDEQRQRAFATLDGHNTSPSDAKVPSSCNDISQSPNDLSGRMNNVSLERSVSLGPNETKSNTVPPRALRSRTPLPPPSPTTSSLNEEYELQMTMDLASSEDWKKYLVKGNDQRNDSRRNNQEQPQPQSVASKQCGDNNQIWNNCNVADGKMRERRSASSERSCGSSGLRGGRQHKSKMSSRGQSVGSEQIKSRSVRKMAFTDQFGDFGYYTGCVNDNGRPDGKGSMKYNNGVFYEGTWTNGCQDKDAASQYERIRSGFTSWGGKGQGASKSGSTLPWNSRKNDTHDDRAKNFVRGMEWIDFNGHSGRYTGAVNNDQIPHGTGIMKYEYGLIAQGQWINGVLKEGPHDRMISAAASMGVGMSVLGGSSKSIGPGMSVGPGPGMSIGPGISIGQMSSIGPGMSVGPGLGPGMSIGPMSCGVSHVQFPMVPMMQPPPMQYGGMDSMVAAQNYYAAVAQRNNAVQHMNNIYGGGGGQMPPLQMQNTMQHMSEMPQNSDKPPISEINIER
jgi:hypothetical protein